jgi:hypothetical protein
MGIYNNELDDGQRERSPQLHLWLENYRGMTWPQVENHCEELRVPAAETTEWSAEHHLND